MKIARITFFLVAMPLLLSCAKKIDTGSGDGFKRVPRNQTHIDPDIQNFFLSQKAHCSEADCPPSVAKVVVYIRGEVKYCSGVLVSDNVLLTSSNCLGRNLKLPNVSCVNNIYAIFPDVPGFKEERAFCSTILSSTILDEDQDPALWRSDFAFVKLKSSPRRPWAEISTEGLKRDQNYTVWKMEYETDQRTALKRETCRPLFDSYANPFSQRDFSPMVTVANCLFNEGNMGAPLFNFRGEVSGILSAKMDKSLSNYINSNDILSEKMLPIQHVSNLACADLPLYSELGRPAPKECSKKINVALLDRYRSRLINSREIHKENMIAIERELEQADKYFMWDVKFFSNKKGNVYEAHFGRPKCFFAVDSWIKEFSSWWGRRISSWGRVDVSIPKYLLKTKLDGKLKPVSFIEKEEMKIYQVEFNPAGAYFEKKSHVTINGFLFGGSVSDSFLNVTDSCGP